MSYRGGFKQEKIKPQKCCFFRKKTFLEVIHPMIWIAKIAGVSALWIKNRDGRITVELSSPRVVKSFYAFLLIGSLCEVLTALYFLKDEDVPSLCYVAMRTFVTRLIHYSLLHRRRKIRTVLQKLQDLGVLIPPYYTLLPIVGISSVLLLSYSLTSIQNPNKKAFLSILVDGGPEFVSLYSCFLYVCMVMVLKREVGNQTSVLAAIMNPLKPRTSLRPIIQRHLLLREITQELNEAFGPLMLLASIAALSEVTFAWFVCMVAGQAFIVAMSVAWSALHLLPLVAIMLACQQVENTMVSTIITYTVILVQNVSWPHTQKVLLSEAKQNDTAN